MGKPCHRCDGVEMTFANADSFVICDKHMSEILTEFKRHHVSKFEDAMLHGNGMASQEFTGLEQRGVVRTVFPSVGRKEFGVKSNG